MDGWLQVVTDIVNGWKEQGYLSAASCRSKLQRPTLVEVVDGILILACVSQTPKGLQRVAV